MAKASTTTATKPPCTFEGCARPQIARGLCTTHYQRWRRHGDAGITHRVHWQGQTCSVAGCDREVHAHGWCVMHYHRWQRDGDPGPADPRPPRIESVWARVDKASGPGECWAWTGSMGPHGPRFNTREPDGTETSLSARRLVYAAVTGADLSGRAVRRTCTTPECVNPAHAVVTEAGRA